MHTIVFDWIKSALICQAQLPVVPEGDNREDDHCEKLLVQQVLALMLARCARVRLVVRKPSLMLAWCARVRLIVRKPSLPKPPRCAAGRQLAAHVSCPETIEF